MNKAVSVSAIRVTIAGLLDDMEEDHEPVVILRNNKPVAVLVSPEMFRMFEQRESA